MIRKQVYLEERHNRKVQRLAAFYGCSEAEVIRSAIDRLPDPEATIQERLEAAGLLAQSVDDDEDVPDGVELQKLEEVYETWMATRQGALKLSEAVLEDRR